MFSGAFVVQHQKRHNLSFGPSKHLSSQGVILKNLNYSGSWDHAGDVRLQERWGVEGKAIRNDFPQLSVNE